MGIITQTFTITKIVLFMRIFMINHKNDQFSEIPLYPDSYGYAGRMPLLRHLPDPNPLLSIGVTCHNTYIYIPRFEYMMYLQKIMGKELTFGCAGEIHILPLTLTLLGTSSALIAKNNIR